MKAKFLVGLIVVLSFSTWGCKEEKQQTTEEGQMSEVMAIHDEVMPKMATISNLVGKLKEKTDSASVDQEKYTNAMQGLQDAHQAMMQWMQGFGERFDSDEVLNGKPLTDEKKQWLDEEEEKVLALREQINQSIARAEAVLKD